MSVQSSVVTDDHIFLSGRPPLSEYIGFVMNLTVDGAAADRAQLAHDWRSANDRVKELELAEAGVADNGIVDALNAELKPLATTVLEHPAVQQSYALMPVSIGVIDLDQLVVYQKAINLGQIARIKERLGADPSQEDVFRLCFPIERTSDPEIGAQEVNGGYTFVSPSNDFRPLGYQLLPPPAVAGFSRGGVPTAYIALAVGYSINLLSAALIEGRLVLMNGSHRAYALRDLGVTRVPCIVQEISRRDEVEILGVHELNQRPDAYLTAPRPPMLRDYFDPALRIVAPVARKDRHVRVAISWNELDLPAPPR